MSIIVITVVLIAVIVGVMFVLRRRKDKPKTTSQSAITQSTEKSYPVYPKGSITDDIDRYHNRFIQSGNESTATTKTSVKSEAKEKGIKVSEVLPVLRTVRQKQKYQRNRTNIRIHFNRIAVKRILNYFLNIY